MQTKTTWTILVVLLGLLVWAQSASAFYNPQTGRWLSRDPIGVKGGLNLCVFNQNNPIDKWDYLGLLGTPSSSDKPAGHCPKSDGGMKLQGEASYLGSGKIACLYQLCGEGSIVSETYEGFGIPTQTEQWRGDDPVNGYCVTITCKPTITVTWRINCGCKSKIVYYSAKAPRTRLGESDTTNGKDKGTAVPINEEPGVSCTEEPNGKFYFLCNLSKLEL